MKMKNTAFSVLVTMALLLSAGCKAPKDVTYFQDAESIINVAGKQPIKVRPEDKLSIVVKSKDPAVSDLFNLPVYSQRVGTGGVSAGNGTTVRNYNPSASDGISLYTVDPAGCIDFPLLGKLKIEGMTRSEVAGFIKGELMGRDLVKDPTVTVEFVNAGVNLIGEVTVPGRYDLNTDHLNLIEAIALAGDLTINGRRDNVRVLREENGKINVYTVDLTNLKNTAASPVYYLRQNDVVYVEPNDMRKREATVNGNNALSTSFWISVASLITTAVTTIGVFVQK